MSEPRSRFRYGLNTSTIRGQKLSLPDEIDLAAKVGYDGIEPWIRELDDHVKAGGSLADIRKRAEDRGLEVYSAIGFFDWAVDDDQRRAKGLEEARRSLDLVRQIGGKRLATPPAGATNVAMTDLRKLAEHYRAVLEIGEELGVTPMLELWGFSQTLSRLGECAQVAIEAGHPRAAVLADVYHLHKGGSAFGGLAQLGPGSVQVFHVNDYPADPPRETITDAHRVYPGDGVAPFPEVISCLNRIGFDGFLSLELFNKDYWQQDAELVARSGLAKMKAAFPAGDAG